MLPSYKDITDKLGKPLWYDKEGVPRYEPFSPEMVGVYAKWVAYMTIQCQECGQEFKVAIDYSEIDQVLGNKVCQVKLPELGSAGWFSYGDPPRHGTWNEETQEGCSAGDTMSSVEVRVEEFWVRDYSTGTFTFQRKPEYEVDVYPQWMKS